MRVENLSRVIKFKQILWYDNLFSPQSDASLVLMSCVLFEDTAYCTRTIVQPVVLYQEGGSFKYKLIFRKFLNKGNVKILLCVSHQLAPGLHHFHGADEK